jgi:hypothetical protein
MEWGWRGGPRLTTRKYWPAFLAMIQSNNHVVAPTSEGPETKMIRFGFPAFLKILSLNDKPQIREVSKRLGPSLGTGYDFHKSLRDRSHSYLVDGEAFVEVIASAGSIKNPAEQNYAIAALHRLQAWRTATPGEILEFDDTVMKVRIIYLR